MPITANDVDVLHQYAEGVMNRADHHAGQVKGSPSGYLAGSSGAANRARSRSSNMPGAWQTSFG